MFDVAEAPSLTIDSPASSSSRPLRLRAVAADGPTGTLDGGWWPYTRDLRVEAEHLVEQFPSWFDRVWRVVYSSPDWVDIGTVRFRMPGGVVTLHPFAGADTHVVMLRSVSTSRVIQLLVVPPHWSENDAEAVMAEAADPVNRRSGSGLLAHHRDGQLAGEHRPPLPSTDPGAGGPS